MENSESKISCTAHVAIVPTPGMGHLIPLAELAKRLVHHHHLSVTFITFAESASNAQRSFLDSLPASITSHTLPPVDLSDLSPSAKIETRISHVAARSVANIASFLLHLKTSHNLVAFVADLFCTDTFDAATQAGVDSYLFLPSNFLLLSVMLHAPALDKLFSCEYRQLRSPVQLPGCPPVHGKDIPAPLQDKKDEAYQWVLHHGRRFREATAILTNTFDEFEPEAAKVMKRFEEGRPPVYSVGPLVRTANNGRLEAEDDDNPSRLRSLRWLDEQPVGSVLYVSFGSVGALSTEQTAELALGLEMSGQRFLWVARSPTDGDSSAGYFSAQSAGDPLEFLPEGFVERTKGVGLIEPSWAPQMEVLGHESVAGFLTHCGWNSTLESVVNGVPMIAWPLFAEQKQNAVLLVEDAKIALRTEFGSGDGIARRQEICRTVRKLTEGEEGKEVRRKVRCLQEAGEKALQAGGNSYKALAQIANHWKQQHQ